MRLRIYPWKQGSRSAKLLAQKLNAKVLRRVNSKFTPKDDDVIINWGSSALPDFGGAAVLNRSLKIAQNKLDFFKTLEHTDVSTPEFWTSKDDIPEEKFPVCARTVLNGHSGDGLVIAGDRASCPGAPLYTQYVKKKDEYRVHVCCGEAFFIQRKARKLDCPNPNWQIRNLAGGFVFVEAVREEVPTAVIDQSIITLNALSLDFGGVDVIWNDHEQKAYVLEVNTACGLEGRTAEKYAEAFLKESP